MKKPTMQQKKVAHIENSVKFGYDVLANELNTINGNIAVVDSTIRKIRENIKEKQEELEELQNDLKEALLSSKELTIKQKHASTIVTMVKNLHDQNFEEEVVDVVEVEEEESELEEEEQSELEDQSEIEEEEQSEIEEEEQSEVEEQKSKADETPHAQKRKINTVETPPTIKKARLTDAVNYCIEARKQQGSFSIYGVSKQFEVPRTTLRREYQKAVERVGSLMNKNDDENNPFDEMLKTEKVDMRSLRQKIMKLDVEDNGGTPITVSVKYKGVSTADMIKQLGISQKNRIYERFYKPKE